MKNPVRITVALDEESYEIIQKLKEEFKSQSELIREVLAFYYSYRTFKKLDHERIIQQIELLSNEEHVILDIDHLTAFMMFVETHPNSEEFWKLHEKVAKAHAEEFSGKDIRYVLKRLESCNLFRFSEKNNEFTIILRDEYIKKFVKSFLEVVLSSMGFKFEIKEDLKKLRLKIC